MLGIGRGPATQIVGDVVVRVEIEIRIDATIHQLGHTPIELSRRTIVQSHQVGFSDPRADMEMHMALELHDACQDAVEVFARFLLIMAVFLGQV